MPLWLINVIIGHLGKLKPDNIFEAYSSRERTRNLLFFDKVSTRLLVDVFTDNCAIERISERMNYPANDFYRSCWYVIEE